jgi:hypothetical protein
MEQNETNPYLNRDNKTLRKITPFTSISPFSQLEIDASTNTCGMNKYKMQYTSMSPYTQQ